MLRLIGHIVISLFTCIISTNLFTYIYEIIYQKVLKLLANRYLRIYRFRKKSFIN